MRWQSHAWKGLLFVLAIVFTVSCVRPGAEDQTPTVRLGFSAWPGWFPWQVAQEKGIFAAKNVQVDLKWFDSYKELIETTYMLGGNRVATVMQVIFPYVLPGILDACRINLAAAWQLVIVAELVAATEGLGRRISLAGRFLRTDEIFVGLIVIGLIGLVLDLLFQYLVRLTCPWADTK